MDERRAEMQKKLKAWQTWQSSLRKRFRESWTEEQAELDRRYQEAGRELARLRRQIERLDRPVERPGVSPEVGWPPEG